MGTYALIKDNIVVNTVVWEGQDDMFKEYDYVIEYHEGDYVSTGFIYDPETGEFSDPGA